jgi:chloride channel protein, CIC family
MQAEEPIEGSAAPEARTADIRSEIQEYTVVHSQRRRLLPRAALVGLVAGLVASLFRLALAGGDIVRNALIEWAHHFPTFGWIFPVLFGIAGAVISLALVRRFSPESKGSGIPHLKAVQYRFRTMSWKRILPVKFIAGVLAIGSGMTLGREGPTVQMGGSAGDLIADLLKVSPRERRTLIAAGAGAGLAAAFNAPLSGLTFVLEEVQRDFHPIVFAATFVACVISDIVARALTGPSTVFSVPSYPAQPLGALPMFAILGIAEGFTGVLFNRGLIASLNLFGRVPARFRLAAAGVVGVLVGITAWFSPVAVGSGHGLAEQTLAGALLLGSIPLWFGLRFLLTMFSYGSGTAGGIFAPLLVLGALVGLATGQLGHIIAPGVVTQPAVFAVVGMAAYFTAVVRAPLTGILLIVEMTGSYAQMLPLLVACFCAYAIAELLKALPIYEELLERDLSASDEGFRLKEPIVVDLLVEPHAPFDGLLVRNLGLPPGCVLVRVVDGGHESIPTASTRLEGYMRITALISPDAENGLALLRTGCKAEPGE